MRSMADIVQVVMALNEGLRGLLKAWIWPSRAMIVKDGVMAERRDACNLLLDL